MIDRAIAGDRIIGMIQPLEGSEDLETNSQLYPTGCVGKITRFSETGDGRYLVTLTGVSRFRVAEELEVDTPYRQCRVNYDEFHFDLQAGLGENDVDRGGMIRMLREFAEYSKLEVDWASIDAAPSEALVNALAMMSPFGPNEKQALLEATDLKSRAEMLIALAESRNRATGERPPVDALSRGADMSDEAGKTQGETGKQGVEPTRVDPRLLEILVCPLTKSTLEYDAERQELISRSARLAYPIRDGIPIMLPEEARRIE